MVQAATIGMMPSIGLQAIAEKEALAHLEEESSNTLFEVLAEWERHLTHLDLHGLERDNDEYNK
tara:strand:+ start:5600 stop:5791 length:192 start_codon:yes stop_codon:yes gene_type:complete